MEDTDRRIKRTRRMLRDALMTLIVEKGYDVITIRDITDRADVAYATFFRHYESKEALLGEQIDLLIKEFESMGHAAPNEHPIKAEGELFFQHVAAHQALYRSLLDKKSSRAVMSRLKQVVAEHTRPHAEAHYQQLREPEIPLEVSLNHIAASACELVAWWLDNNMPLSPEQMACIYERLVIEATWYAVSGER
jgi:AcrR family transcriptional regulator